MFLFDYDEVTSAARERINSYQEEAKKNRAEPNAGKKGQKPSQKDRQSREFGERAVNEGFRLKGL